MVYKIAVLGDFNPYFLTHHALNDSIRQVTKDFNEDLQFDWIPTDTEKISKSLSSMYCGLWIAPGSPYKNMQNVIDVIQYARENKIPTFGNCGGFQHMIIEFARNVCGIDDADHEEVNPDASRLLISKLECSLVAMEEELTISSRNSQLYDILQRDKIIGKYFCSYGINDAYLGTLKEHGLKFTAFSQDQQVRAFEITEHSFYIGTLFQPALTSTPDEINPLITAFVSHSIISKG